MTITIYPFMITKLKLSGADLLIYALLYSNAREYIWRGYRNLGREVNLNVHTVITSLGRLVDKNLVEKLEDGYRVKNDTEEEVVSNLTQNTGCVKINTDVKIDTKVKLKRKEI